MKKKKSYPNIDIMWDININSKNADVSAEYVDYLGGKTSPDIKDLIDNHKNFSYFLCDFVRKYDETFKKLKMKKEHQDQYGYSMMTVTLQVKNGIGIVGYFPLLDGTHKFEKKMYGGFKIKKADMLKFLINRK